MKRLLALFATAALCLMSCDKNVPDPRYTDENGNTLTPEERFWNVVGQLVSMDDISKNYKTGTFKPIIGTPEEGNETARVVLVNTLDAAVELYNSMVGANIDENTRTHTFEDPEVGTIVWNKDDSGKSWATVDVDIPAVPTLQKIIYRAPQQGDANGSVGDNGSAYYRFGDVIQRTRAEDNALEYWICVRPAFDKEGKGDSHWVSVSPLPDSNIWPYYQGKTASFTASNGMSYSFPYGLRDGTTWYQDLVEMLFAIYYPDEWFNNVINYSTEGTFGVTGLRIFKDFHVSRIKYHNVAFWTNVQNMWKQKGMARRLFGLSDQELSEMLKSENGMNFLYKSSSWSTSTSNKPKSFHVRYKYDTGTNEKRNMRNQTTTTISTKQVVEPKKTTPSAINYPFDIKKEITQTKPYIKNTNYFGDDAPRWMIRYAEGSELAANGKFDPQQPISGFEKVKGGEVYRYYQDVFPDKNLTDEAEVSEYRRGIVNDPASWDKSPYSGEHHYEFGDVLRDDQGHLWIVVGISGGARDFSQHSTFAEIVSFDGIQTGNNNAVATNIVTREQALRASVYIWFLIQEAHKQSNYGVSVNNNVKSYASVDFGRLSRTAYSQNSRGMTVPIEDFSVAYYEQGSTQQHLLRFSSMMGVGNEYYTSLWTRYPSSNVTEIDKYTELKPGDFSSVDIYLQDVASQTKITSYANDAISRAPVEVNSTVQSPVRMITESRASDVRNYFYNNSTWSAGTQPTGMWNEPVLFFRMSALYDRGGEYSTKTADGLNLTMVNRVTLEPAMGGSDLWYQAAWPNQTGVFRKLNGEENNVPTWQSLWAK